MDNASALPVSSWSIQLREQVQARPLTALGLLIALAAVLLLLLQSLIMLATDDMSTGVRYGLIGGVAGFAATALGALPALFLRSVQQRVEDAMLGFAAGMMLAASAFSLLLPGLEAAEGITLAAAVVVAGMTLGVLLMLGLDQFTPHEHDKTGPCGPGHQQCSRVWLFVFAIALHNLPEGMAIGVSFSQGDMSVGLPLTTAIALQDIPEGLAVALAMCAAGFRPWVAVLVAIASGLLEPLGALLGVGLSSGMAIAYPIGLGLAAGAMLFVVSHEVIPETHRNGHQTHATLGLMAGFALMMTLDTALG
ncbi:TPA: ZIP family metal transporter [Aeromonas salmonicida subsp. salmonicida]|uniref:ZIP family metal transporter n=1 Tax=Aeromonas salmonicida TaxID=645 RepID=UPI00131F6C38|nr:ZIP family metal transporter [Aeromonas salmonicida]ELI6420278.1 ZIP family metal transporter [Aeromonas salmonicida subsp. salmonicida]ELM3648724.1 ZIP family metal transporter [Aeromonas salmonicida subsp. salmonicida]QHE42197.1 ZIP family metal transporter [Aeromonas salmonicida subsp. salmonicida]QHE47586.1 ZIP family metal transporter [Aeromonas salmonicida subsp. salmonicida]QJF55295.1 ZIP family metal transporter [Aeromonas salmonicida subsp. salmonicida]